MVIVFYIILLILKRKILLLESQDQEVVSASKSKLKLNLMIDDDRRIIGELNGISSVFSSAAVQIFLKVYVTCKCRVRL